MFLETFGKSPLQLSNEEVEESFWVCIGTIIYTKLADSGFYFMKDPPTGLVMIKKLKIEQDNIEEINYSDEL